MKILLPMIFLFSLAAGCSPVTLGSWNFMGISESEELVIKSVFYQHFYLKNPGADYRFNTVAYETSDRFYRILEKRIPDYKLEGRDGDYVVTFDRVFFPEPEFAYVEVITNENQYQAKYAHVFERKGASWVTIDYFRLADGRESPLSSLNWQRYYSDLVEKRESTQP